MLRRSSSLVGRSGAPLATALEGRAGVYPRSVNAASKPREALVGRPGDSFSGDPAFGIGVGPADWSGMLGVGADVLHQLATEISH